ncbi:chemotaxis protein CheW [Blastococcus sp. KM273128]|uniref:chemotaxis protein CheW n=1 Tax=Blastococcus sp. KM273128 TaxID=2570314 RepID=UPI001F28578A|nr:chemotaxis protein CheW [Blastococcus sp. KM273128]
MTTPTAPATAGENAVLGLLRLGGMDVAVPLTSLREVVPCPPKLAGLPASADGLLGAMRLRDLALPVADLRPMLRQPAPRADDQVVVVVAAGERALGLLADQVRGVLHLAAEQLVPVTAEGDALLFAAAFLHPETGDPVSVLDGEALLARPGMPTIPDLTRALVAEERRAAGSGPRRRMVTVRCGGYLLALDVDHVHTTLPAFTARSSVLDGGACLGVVDFAGAEVPVADPLVLLGLGETGGGSAGAGVVLDLGSGYVVLAVTELLDLLDVPATDVLPFPAIAARRPDLVTGSLVGGGGAVCLVVDGPALLADRDVVGLAAVNTALDDPASAPDACRATSGARDGRGVPQLVFTAGVDVAAPLDQVVEILPYPADLVPTDAHATVLGVTVHRHAAVPVVDLGAVLGRGSSVGDGASCLLLVAADGEQVAFAVGALRGIEPLVWRDPDQPVRPAATADRLLHSAPLVQVGAESRLLPQLDLQALARALRPDRVAETVGC